VTAARTAIEVLEDHLRRAEAGDTEGDLSANYAEGVVLLTGIGELHGHDGVRESRAVLAQDLPTRRFEYLTKLVAGEYAFLEWRGEAEQVRVEDGADSFVIRDGQIVMQTIHYTLSHRTGHHRRIQHSSRDAGTRSALTTTGSRWDR
jgi:hypothetical protein